MLFSKSWDGIIKKRNKGGEKMFVTRQMKAVGKHISSSFHPELSTKEKNILDRIRQQRNNKPTSKNIRSKKKMVHNSRFVTVSTLKDVWDIIGVLERLPAIFLREKGRKRSLSRQTKSWFSKKHEKEKRTAALGIDNKELVFPK